MSQVCFFPSLVVLLQYFNDLFYNEDAVFLRVSGGLASVLPVSQGAVRRRTGFHLESMIES